MAVMSVLAGPGAVSSQGSELAIPISGHWEATQNPNRVGIGEPCAILNPAGLTHQVIVRDETDTIVAVLTLDGTWQEQPEHDFLACSFDTEIPVPERAFYSLYLGDERLFTYAAADLPISADQVIHLIVPEN
jgi:hypothetical protein